MSMLHRNSIVASLAIVAALWMGPGGARADGYRAYDATPVWPLCGRISEDPPPGWSEVKGCPTDRWGDPDHADYPLTTTFGPRPLYSQGNRFDFHRGLDIPTAEGTPVFAMARGVVYIAGEHSSFMDPLVQIRHFRPGTWGDCVPGGCYHSLYQHMSAWVVGEGQVVEKGQLIGYSGTSSAGGFEHLHFEIRDSRPADPDSAWLRDAIHPLRILPYPTAPAATTVTVDSVDVANPMNPIVRVVVFQPVEVRTLDFNRLEVEIYDNDTRISVAQPGLTADGNGYHVHPPFIDFEQRNLEYTHKNPWSSFDTCPFAGDHGESYSAHVHVCRMDPDDSTIGDFNGVRIKPSLFNNVSEDYQLTVTFSELVGVPDPDNLCVVVHARNARGDYGTPATWNCGF